MEVAMENAVKDLLKTGKVSKKEKSVSKIDYRIIFCAAAAFLVGGAAVFGVFSPKSITFFSLAMIILLSTYLMCKALVVWDEGRTTDIDRTRQILTEGRNAFENLSHVYSRSVCKKNVVETDELKALFRLLNDEVCSKCSTRKNCWDIYSGRTEQYIRSLLSFAEKGDEEQMMAADRKNGFLCENSEAMRIYTKSIWNQMEAEYKWMKKMESCREALAAQFEGSAEVFAKALRAIGTRRTGFGGNTLENVKIGISKYAKDGVVCGDSCAGTKLNENTYVFLLSDGMGSGKRAAGESMLTVNTLYQFLKAGYEPEVALSALNAILVMKSEEEIFATVDAATLSMRTGTVNFYKAGSAEAFIKREGMVETIKRRSLPMGIVEKAKAENVVRRLRPSDMVIMVSDGISEAGAKSAAEEGERPDNSWIEEALMEIKSTDPQTVADLLLSRAIDRYGEGEKDDMSILAFAVS